VFICRRGCNTRTATYTEEFTWEKVYRGAEDILDLVDLVQSQTKATRRKRKREDDIDVADWKPSTDDPLTATPTKRRKVYKDIDTAVVGLQTPTKTPTSRKKYIVAKKPLEFTPLGTRVLSPTHVSSSPFQIARTRLHVSSVPTALPCREEAFATVYGHLESAISEGCGACIYISGTPGTGKTATVREAVAQLGNAVQADELDDFIFVEINGMKVTDPHHSYSLLWEALRGDRVNPYHALDLLEREFTHPNPRRVPCVVLMDELDQLVTKDQSVMYNFFNWPSLPNSRLIVLAVANTMDLPERTLSNKISSRLGLTRITFPGYNHDQLMKIIESRLQGVPGNIVHPDAIQFASRKVAAVSGDARRALDICRRAVEIAESQGASDHLAATPSKKHKSKEARQELQPGETRVTIQTIKQAINEATSSPVQQHLRSLPLASKLFLAAVMARTRRSGVPECVLGDVIDEAKRLAQMAGDATIPEMFLRVPTNAFGGNLTESTAPRILTVGSVVKELVEAGVLSIEARRGERTGKVRLNVNEDEIRLAFKEDSDMRSMGVA
jgi:origin recognition complex subunit 1